MADSTRSGGRSDEAVIMAVDPWRFQTWAFRQTTGSVARKAVLQALATMADKETGRCEAKVPTLAQGTELSDRAVQGHLKGLADAGLIAKRAQYRQDGGTRGSEFLLLAPGVDRWPDGQVVEGVQLVHPGGENSVDLHPGGEAGCTGGVNGASPQELPLKNDRLTNPTSTKSDADQVWEHYLAARKAANPRSNGCKLNPDDARLIREALKVRPVEDILAAIDGLFRSQWHRDGGFIGIKYAVRGGGQRPNAGATIDRLANGRGGTRLKDRTYNGLAWDELTAHAQASAKEAAAMRLEVWDGGKDSWEGAEERRAAAAAVTSERRRNGQVTAGAWDLAGDD